MNYSNNKSLDKTFNKWKEIPLGYVLSFTDSRSVNFETENTLSLTNKGIVKRDISSNEGQIAESYENYTCVKKGYICMNPMDLLSGWVDIANHDGIISPAYYTFIVNENFFTKFVNYFLQSNYYKETFFILGRGVASHDNYGRWVLTSEELKKIVLYYPEIKEQKLISRYLDKKTEQIDLLAEKIPKKIELLKEQRTSLINHYVTKGLDTNIEMKDSEVEWMGEIPKHWVIKKLKYLASYNTDVLPENTDPEYSFHYIEIGDVDYINGVNLKEKITFNGSPSRARRVVKPKDVIVSTVRTYLRAIGVAPDISNVICSTGFCVLRNRSGLLDQNFLSFAVRSEWFISGVISNSKGVSYPAINSSELIELKIALPPLKEQKDIAKILMKKLQNLDNQIQLEKKRINLLKEYRESLISYVISGEVKITNESI